MKKIRKTIAVKIFTVIAGLLLIVYLLIPTQKTYSLPLNTSVTSLSVKPIIDALNAADEGDTVEIHISSPGGEVVAGYELLGAIEKTKARVVMYVDSYAGSMAAVILCYADEVHIADRAVIMFHTIQIDGKPMIVYDDETRALHASYVKTMQQCAFMSDADIAAMSKGYNIWFVGGLSSHNRI